MITPVMQRIGLSTLTYRTLPLAEALSRIRRHGFVRADIAIITGRCDHADPVGMNTDERRAWASMVRDSGLGIASLNVGNGPLNDPDGLDARVAFLEHCIDMADLAGAPVVTINTGSRVPPAQWLDSARRVDAVVSRLARRAADRGVVLSLEAPHVNSLCSTVDEAMRLFEWIHDGRVTLTFDSSHVHCGGDSMRRGLGRMGPWLGHVHLRDAHRDDHALTPGDGDIDFHALFHGLSGVRYAGGIAIELLFPDESAGNLDLIERQVERARAHLRDALRGALV